MKDNKWKIVIRGLNFCKCGWKCINILLHYCWWPMIIRFPCPVRGRFEWSYASLINETLTVLLIHPFCTGQNDFCAHNINTEPLMGFRSLTIPIKFYSNKKAASTKKEKASISLNILLWTKTKGKKRGIWACRWLGRCGQYVVLCSNVQTACGTADLETVQTASRPNFFKCQKCIQFSKSQTVDLSDDKSGILTQPAKFSPVLK